MYDDYRNQFTDALSDFEEVSELLKADRQRCIVCGNKTGDCSTSSKGPHHIVTLGKDEKLIEEDEIVVKEDVWQDTEIATGVWSKTLVVRAGRTIKKKKAMDLGII